MDEQSTSKKSRRRFLKTAAKVAIYTPPAMMAISSPSQTAFAQSGGEIEERQVTKKKAKKKTQVKKKSKKKIAKKKTKKKVIT